MLLGRVVVVVVVVVVIVIPYLLLWSLSLSILTCFGAEVGALSPPAPVLAAECVSLPWGACVLGPLWRSCREAHVTLRILQVVKRWLLLAEGGC